MPSHINPANCVVLVPCANRIEQQCELSLRKLEDLGYTVRRVFGFSAVDQARNQMATDAITDGFEETLWIDSDVGFTPEAVDLLRSHQLPICCAVYPKKGMRSLAANALPTANSWTFGVGGQLEEIHYTGAGFLHIRREVYERVQSQFCLPLCNGIFERGMIPYFMPFFQREQFDSTNEMVGYRYMAEDYAFCARARAAGFSIYADTSIRLSHVGMYEYQWEDAGSTLQRYETYHFEFDSSHHD